MVACFDLNFLRKKNIPPVSGPLPEVPKFWALLLFPLCRVVLRQNQSPEHRHLNTPIHRDYWQNFWPCTFLSNLYYCMHNSLSLRKNRSLFFHLELQRKYYQECYQPCMQNGGGREQHWYSPWSKQGACALSTSYTVENSAEPSTFDEFGHANMVAS